MTIARSIFISYRRRDSIDITGRVYDRLVAHFGQGSVFKDVDAIPLGVNFRRHLEREVSHCPVLLAIIGPQWLGITDARGNPRLANPRDWVRVEIETALRRDSLVIPVLVGGAELPDEAALPESLKGLAYRQSTPVRHDPDFHRDMDRLIQRIEGVFNSLKLSGRPTAQSGSGLVTEPVTAPTIAPAATQSVSSPTLGRRRWLRLTGLGLIGGGAAVAVRRWEPGLHTFSPTKLPEAIPDLSTLPDRLEKALDAATAPIPDATAQPLHTYTSVTVDEFGQNLYQAQVSTPSYQELWLAAELEPMALPLVEIRGGQFVQGALDSEPGYDPSQQPQTIAAVDSFWMGIYPVTQRQWRAVALLPSINRALAPNPAYFEGDDRPVEQVSWLEVVEFCDRLNRFVAAHHPHLADYRFRLPTESEWEYACRSHTTTPFHTGYTLITDLANYDGTQPYRQEPVGQFRGTTTPVGSFGQANAFGLYDMHGNVQEWCASEQEDIPTTTTNASTVQAQASDLWIIVRGGSWQSPPQHCRSAYRTSANAETRSNQIGFRVIAVKQY
jgi:formylglycine-generating enzyme required for sulfatase activity